MLVVSWNEEFLKRAIGVAWDFKLGGKWAHYCRCNAEA